MTISSCSAKGNRFETLRRALPHDAPWSAEDAEWLDSVTMQDWIDQNTTTVEGRAWFTGITRQTISGDLRQVSLLWMLHFFNTTGDVFLCLNVDAEGIRFVGGVQQLSLKLAQRFSDRIWLDAPVRQIVDYDHSQVQIFSDRGIVTAKTAIMAMMPKDVKNIEFQPPLPSLHRQLIEQWRTMSWVKFYAFYEKPFWHSRTRGSHFLDESTRFDVYDVSPDDGSQGILVGLLSPDYSTLSAQERKACCLNFLAEICGESARQPQNFIEFDWNRQAWTGGCVTALPHSPKFCIIEAPSILGLKPTGVDRLLDALREAGFYDKLCAKLEARVPAPAFNPERDPVNHLLNARSIANYSRSIAQVVKPVVQSKQFPIVLGGDCSILLGNLLALRKLGRYGLFFLDGHPDFCLPENDPVGELASMDLAIATGRCPDIVANLDGLRPLVREEDTVVFGYRDGEATEGIGENNIKSTQIYAQTLDAIRQVGVKQAAIHALDQLMQKPLDGIWIHLDVDVLDDAIMPAVDYRMPGGMSFEELTKVLQVLIALPKAIGLEVTIFNPSLDPDGSIARTLTSSLVAGLML